MFVSGTSEGLVYVSTYLDRSVRLIEPLSRRATILVDGAALGMTDIGNCLVDGAGELWVNEVEGRAIWHFSPSGERLERIGAPAGSGGEAHSARPGASPLPESMRFEEARFGWIADIRLGPSGNIYVLDAGSLALWSLDPNLRRITRVAGSGEAGDAGEGGPALLVSLGEDKSRRFGGPISLSIDEEGNAFIGDAANGRVLVVEAATGRAHAIARGLKGLCSMDYFEGRLFLPEDGGRLLVLERGDA
jgi:sugar lactone lactonase YvrE